VTDLIVETETTDAARYPTLTEHGRRLLDFMREHPHAPIYRNESGNRLTAEDVQRVREFERDVATATVGWKPGTIPDWVDAFVDRCFATTPFYRRYGDRPREFGDIPTISRADLARDISQFVPDDVAIDRLINFQTSGTSGHPLLIASLPSVAASYLAFHKRALRRVGIELTYGRGQVGVVLVGFQRKCFTYVSVTPTMDESGLAKINLHPNDWRHSADRAKYLDAMAPEVFTGDPIAFAELATLPLQWKPRAMLSTSMALRPGSRRVIEERFGCPLLDIYSLNETGPIGVYDANTGGHVLLQPRMFVEIVDRDGNAVAPGERGEICLTGGFNPCLPLVRYRTGDYAALKFGADEPVLVDLQGRPPVRFRTLSGEWLNNIEVTHALNRFALTQFTLHQGADGSLMFRYAGARGDETAIRAALLSLFGAAQLLVIEPDAGFDDKVIQYTSEIGEALC
jgi:phenylacetate-CoA ligase